MQRQSPVAMRASADLDRMQALLAATGIPASITPSSFPTLKLDVEACYDHLNNSKNQRPEDLVMRQALELYCSLISPPTTPTGNIKLRYQPEQDPLPVTPSGIFNCEDEYRPSISYDEPKVCNYDPSRGPNGPFGFASGQNFTSLHSHYVCQADQTHYSWSTPSCVSDHENSDTDDMDDPFACYPLSQPRRLTPQAYSPAINYDHHGRSSYEASSRNFAHSYSSQQRFQIPAPPLMGQLEGSLEIDKAASTHARSLGNLTQPLARRSFFSPTVEPIAHQTKSSGRKRSFSVVSFVKQRKALPSNAASLRITGPMPIANSHSTSSTGTFSVPVRTSQSSGGQLSLSPALEANEDLTPITPIPSKPTGTRPPSKSGPLFPAEEMSSINSSRQYSARPEAKSLWKTIKTSTSRSSCALERPLVQHFNH